MAAADVLAFAPFETYCSLPTRNSTRQTGLTEDSTDSFNDALLNLRLGLIAEAWMNLQSATVSSCLFFVVTILHGPDRCSCYE